MSGTPKDYEYLLLCDGSTIDSNNYPDLCEKLGGNTLPNLVGKFDQTMNPSGGNINLDIGPTLGFKKGEISSVLFMINNNSNEVVNRACYITETNLDNSKRPDTLAGLVGTNNSFDKNFGLHMYSNCLGSIFVYRTIGTYNFAEKRHNSYIEQIHSSSEFYKHRIYLDKDNNIIKTVDIETDNFDPFSPTPTFSSDSANTETSTQSLEQTDPKIQARDSSSTNINYYICYA